MSLGLVERKRCISVRKVCARGDKEVSVKEKSSQDCEAGKGQPAEKDISISRQKEQQVQEA